jgi:hypothetical protein
MAVLWCGRIAAGLVTVVAELARRTEVLDRSLRD